ncbi:Lrp/AsnC family transcriptional regulator [Magnetospira thiophila]
MVIMSLDRTDLKILDALQTDSRQTNLALAEKIGLSPTPCARRVRRLEEEGVIKRYKVDIDLARVGLNLTIFVGVKVERHQDDEANSFVDAVTSWPEVIACHLVSGDIDFLLEVVTSNMEVYERFVLQRLLKIKSVKDVRSNFAMRTYKTNGHLPVHLLHD